MDDKDNKNQIGRPSRIIECIDDSPENVVNILMNSKPENNNEWKYLR